MDEQFQAGNPRLQALAEAAELAEGVVETVSESILLLDRDLHVRFANRSFYLTFQVMPQDTLDRPVFEIGNGQWDLPGLRQLLEEVLPGNTSFQNFEVTHEFPAIGRKVMNLHARKLRRRRTDQRMLILLALEDITARKQIEQELTRTKGDLRWLTHRLLTAEDNEHRRIASELRYKGFVRQWFCGAAIPKRNHPRH